MFDDNFDDGLMKVYITFLKKANFNYSNSDLIL